MAKISRRILCALLATAGIVVLAAALCLDGVDYRPYLNEPYYRLAMGRLQAVALTNTLARGELFAGFGRALLSPRLNAQQDNPSKGEFRSLPLAGYGNRHSKPAQGIHDDLYVKALALRVGDRLGIMLAADALIIPPEVTDLVMSMLNSEFRLSRE